jgi:hypothetical protein
MAVGRRSPSRSTHGSVAPVWITGAADTVPLAQAPRPSWGRRLCRLPAGSCPAVRSLPDHPLGHLLVVHTKGNETSGAVPADGRLELEQLRAEVSGLRRALESRGLIERAKGVLMHRHGWTADDAFQYLARLSQHTNVRLAELADRVVAEASARGLSASDEACTYRLLDLLTHPAMMLRPLPGRDRPVVDFRVEYANPATVDSAGRRAGEIVGRRVSKLYPPAVASDILRICQRALEADRPAERPGGDGAGPSRLTAVPLLNRVLLTW